MSEAEFIISNNTKMLALINFISVIIFEKREREGWGGCWGVGGGVGRERDGK